MNAPTRQPTLTMPPNATRHRIDATETVSRSRTLRFGFLAAMFIITGSLPATAATLQVDLTSLLNARIVTTLSGGRLVPWTDALDNAGSGEATCSAALRMGDANPRALPDDGLFPATASHPRVRLHFSDARATGDQVHRSVGRDDFKIAVPPTHYRQLWIFCMSGLGKSLLTVTLSYTDGSSVQKRLTVPDWYFPAQDNDPRLCNLAGNLGKWGKDNRMMEKDHHYLVGIDLAPDARRTLTGVRIEKSDSGVLTLWGMTGVTP